MLFSRLMSDRTRMMTRLVTLPADQREQSDLFKPIPDCQKFILVCYGSHLAPGPSQPWRVCSTASQHRSTELALPHNNMTWRSDGGVSLRHLVNLRELDLDGNQMHRDVHGLLAALPPNLERLGLTKGLRSGREDTNRFTQEQVQQLVDGLPASVTELEMRDHIGIQPLRLDYRDSLRIKLGEFYNTGNSTIGESWCQQCVFGM